MQQKTLLAITIVMVVISISGFTAAYAQTEPGIESGLELGIGVVAAGSVSGAVLSITRVAGKALKNKPEGMDSGKFFTNVLVGAIIGVALSAAGMSAASLEGNTDIIALASISSNFMFVYIFNESLRPMFNKWLKNWGKEEGTTSNKPKTG